MIATLFSIVMTLQTPTGAIEGTLIVPESKTPVPVVLIIAGSGPTDRDGNSAMLLGSNNSLKMLAEGLLANGIASLRYDKRGIAKSAAAGPKESDLRFDIYVDDAARWVKQLHGDPRFSRVIVAGHSEGSLIGMIAAQRGDVDRFISLAGAGRRAGDTIRTQLEGRISAELNAKAGEAITLLEAGKMVTDPPPTLAALFRPTVQPYLISWFRYDPAEEIAKLKIPTLVIQGTTDNRVTVDDAKRLSKSPVIIEGMNHVMKQVGPDAAAQQNSYSDSTLPLHPALLRAIVDFIHPERSEGSP